MSNWAIGLLSIWAEGGGIPTQMLSRPDAAAKPHCFEHLKRDCLELLEKEPENKEYRRFVPKFVDLLREASEHSGFRAFEHSSIYSLRCSQA